MLLPGLRLKGQMAWLGMNWTGEQFVHHSLLQSSHLHTYSCGYSSGSQLVPVVRLGRRKGSSRNKTSMTSRWHRIKQKTHLKNPFNLINILICRARSHFSGLTCGNLWRNHSISFSSPTLESHKATSCIIKHSTIESLKMEALMGKSYMNGGLSIAMFDCGLCNRL